MHERQQQLRHRRPEPPRRECGFRPGRGGVLHQRVLPIPSWRGCRSGPRSFSPEVLFSRPRKASEAPPWRSTSMAALRSSPASWWGKNTSMGMPRHWMCIMGMDTWSCWVSSPSGVDSPLGPSACSSTQHSSTGPTPMERWDSRGFGRPRRRSRRIRGRPGELLSSRNHTGQGRRRGRSACRGFRDGSGETRCPNQRGGIS